jgi:predicted kinase
MIVSIRGTSGSGKSTLVRDVMSLYPQKSRIMIKDRARPIGYLLSGRERTLFVVGHYETACGGCDTIPVVDDIYDMVRRAHEEGHNVLFEGLIISAEYKRMAALHSDGLPLEVLVLDTPIEECLAGINARRRADLERRTALAREYNREREERAESAGRKPPKPRPMPEYRGDVDPANTISKMRGIENTMKRLLEDGVSIARFDREAAGSRLKELLR